MTVTDGQQAFEQALRQDDDSLLLVTFLRLIVAVEHAIHTNIQQIHAIESTDNPELYREILQWLIARDMLGYVSGASAQEVADLRRLLGSAAPDRIMSWYHRQWSQRAITAAEIIASIASALRTAMTVIYGNIYLLRQYTGRHTGQETAYQHITEAVDTLRSCRNQLQDRLATQGIEVPLF
jgi:signal transduction histidine kinase